MIFNLLSIIIYLSKKTRLIMAKILKKDCAIYIHYPFCESKCPYCDFNSHVEQNIDHKLYEESYIKEIEYFKNIAGSNKKITSIFFGGGTPSLMPINLIEKILENIDKNFTLDKDIEISLEANPSSYESKKFKAIKDIGVNRLSIGVQSFNDNNLKFLGRKHDAKEALSAIAGAANVFDNFSFDLMYCLPNQSPEEWIKELQRAISLNSKHLSLYQLTIEKGTKFYQAHLNNEFQMPDEETSYAMFQDTCDIMNKNQFEHYEISNFSKPDYQCRHNLNYWQGVDYFGLGAGAHSRMYLDNEELKSAIVNYHKPDKWLKKIKECGNAIQNITKISNRELLEEVILTGLRLENGISNDFLIKTFGQDISTLFNKDKLQPLMDNEMIILTNEMIKIDSKQKAIANLIIFKMCEAINYQ